MTMAFYAKRTKVDEAEFLAAIEGSCGQLEPIERKLSCTRKALRELLAAKPYLQDELDDEMERELDRTVISALKDAQDPDSRTAPKSRELVLKAKARDRGFGDKLEVSGTDGAPLVFLHTAAQLPNQNMWQIQADTYAENEDARIEAEMEKIGIGGNSNKALGNR